MLAGQGTHLFSGSHSVEETACEQVCSAAREWVPVSPTYRKDHEFSITKFEGKTTQGRVLGLEEQKDLPAGDKAVLRCLAMYMWGQVPSRGAAAINNTPTPPSQA